jgi:hypothetical protein
LGAGEKRERREQGGKLGTRDKGKRGKRERGTDHGDQGNQIRREQTGGAGESASGDSSPWRSPLKSVALQSALSGRLAVFKTMVQTKNYRSR